MIPANDDAVRAVELITRSMADAILVLINNPTKAQQIRSAGLNVVKNYSWPEVRSRLLGVYENVLRKTDNFKKES